MKNPASCITSREWVADTQPIVSLWGWQRLTREPKGRYQILAAGIAIIRFAFGGALPRLHLGQRRLQPQCQTAQLIDDCRIVVRCSKAPVRRRTTYLESVESASLLS